MTQDLAKWHWGEGMKYALEGIKLLFILNGAAAVSILTFVGNTKESSIALIASMVFFALGSLAGIITMLMAYLTQLSYGNAEQQSLEDQKHTCWATASRHHYTVYALVVLGILCFVIGVSCAATGMYARANITLQ